MNIYKRPDSPFWWYSFSYGGRVYRNSTKRPMSDRAGARKVLMNEYQKVLDQAQLGIKGDITLREAMELTNDTVEGKTRQSYELSMRKFCGEPPFDTGYWHLNPTMKMSELTRDKIDAFRRERTAEGLKSNSVLVEMRYIKRVYNLVKKNFQVVPDLEFKGPKAEAKTRYLSDQEEQAVLEELHKHTGLPAYDKARDLFIFLLDTGARLNEAVTVDWSDVNFLTARIELYRPKNKGLTQVPMSSRVKRMLEQRQDQPFPFHQMSRAIRLLRQVINKTCNRNQLIVERRGKATLHSLRDTFATRLLAKGMTLKKVSGLLGHNSIKMTEKYAHLEKSEVLNEALEILNG